MPIYDKGYRSFDGAVRRRLRWLTIVRQEWRIIRKRWIFWVLMVPPIILTILMGLYIYIVDIIATNPNHPWAQAASDMPMTQIDGSVFFSYVRRQMPFVFIVTLLAGAGMIANDFRYNLVDVYFSKPLSWPDYVLGKAMTLVFIGLGMTLVPAVALMLLHLMFTPSMDTLKEMYWLPLPTAAFALAVILPSALCTLASSSFFTSQRFAAITLFMLLIVNGAFGTILPPLLRDESLHVMAFPLAINRLGEHVFDQAALRVPGIDPGASFVFWVIVCAVALAVVCAKVRRAGAAA